MNELNGKQLQLTNKEGELAQLRASLSASTSKIGDWKVIKCYEAKLQGKDMPYDLEGLMMERQYVRDRINEVQAEIEVLKEEVRIEMEEEMAQTITANDLENV